MQFSPYLFFDLLINYWYSISMPNNTFSFHMMILLLLVLVVLPSSDAVRGGRAGSPNQLDALMRSSAGVDEESGTTWAVLVAGSSEYYNYRHQVISYTY